VSNVLFVYVCVCYESNILFVYVCVFVSVESNILFEYVCVCVCKSSTYYLRMCLSASV